MGTSLGAIIGQSVPTAIVCRNPTRAAELFEFGARTYGAVESHSQPIVVASIADLAKIGGVSVIFVATKTTAIPQIAAELRPCMDDVSDHPDGPFVISYQNGIEPGRQLMQLLACDRVLRMVLTIGASMREHGAVEITLNSPPHFIGAPGGLHRDACLQIAALLSQAGLESVYDDNIELHVWLKGVQNASMNPVAALVNSTVGQVLQSPSRLIVERLMREGLAVANAEGFDFGKDFIERTNRVYERAGDHTPSMVEDIRQGRESEVGQLNSQVLEHARKLGISTPTHEIINALIETFDWKAYAAMPS